MHKTIAEIEAMSGSEFAEWQYHFRNEPMTDHFWIGGQICSVIYNVNRGKDAKPRGAEDFVPRMKPKQQTPKEMARALGFNVGE